MANFNEVGARIQKGIEANTAEAPLLDEIATTADNAVNISDDAVETCGDGIDAVHNVIVELIRVDSDFGLRGIIARLQRTVGRMDGIHDNLAAGATKVGETTEITGTLREQLGSLATFSASMQSIITTTTGHAETATGHYDAATRGTGDSETADMVSKARHHQEMLSSLVGIAIGRTSDSTAEAQAQLEPIETEAGRLQSAIEADVEMTAALQAKLTGFIDEVTALQQRVNGRVPEVKDHQDAVHKLAVKVLDLKGRFENIRVYANNGADDAQTVIDMAQAARDRL
jgi:chromosome segregation ATPase